MRRFSQRTHLVTLSEINITPLLDLAFVLLIIFVITTPLLQQGLNLELPEGGRTDRPLRKEDFRTLEIGSGYYLFENRRLTFTQMHQQLLRERQANPRVIVFLCADRRTPYEEVFRVADLCANLGIGMSFRSEPPER